LEAFLASVGLVALAEVGDKTQLLSLALASRFRRPVPIILGILFATLLNHALASAVGAWLTSFLGPRLLQWILAASFLAMAIWMLIPDKLDDTQGPGRLGVFGTTFIAFFIAEMGDKTQLATVALAARYAEFYAVVAGTTAGMLLANVPVVIFGERLSRRLPVVWVHRVAALLFAAMGLWAAYAALANAG